MSRYGLTQWVRLDQALVVGAGTAAAWSALGGLARRLRGLMGRYGLAQWVALGTGAACALLGCWPHRLRLGGRRRG